jgi:tetratricopeptide (TPR) repeat protein
MPYLRHALRLEPFIPEANFHYASCLDQTGQLDSAVFYYTRAIQQDNKFLAYYTNLSYVYYRMGKYQESIEVNKEALKNIPNVFDPYVNIGKTYLQLNDYPNAIQYFEQAYKLNTSMTDLWVILAELHRRTGNLQRAQYFDEMIKARQSQPK